MAKRKKTKKVKGQRPFRRSALSKYAKDAIRARVTGGANVARYTVVVPLEEIRPTKKAKITAHDLIALEEMLPEHFGGCTRLPASPGFGPRNPEKPDEEPEMNYNTYFVVYAAPVAESDEYFQALQRELQDALEEGVILIERQLVALM